MRQVAAPPFFPMYVNCNKYYNEKKCDALYTSWLAINFEYSSQLQENFNFYSLG